MQVYNLKIPGELANKRIQDKFNASKINFGTSRLTLEYLDYEIHTSTPVLNILLYMATNFYRSKVL